jgi:hypothetical protein
MHMKKTTDDLARRRTDRQMDIKTEESQSQAWTLPGLPVNAWKFLVNKTTLANHTTAHTTMLKSTIELASDVTHHLNALLKKVTRNVDTKE